MRPRHTRFIPADTVRGARRRAGPSWPKSKVAAASALPATKFRGSLVALETIRSSQRASNPAGGRHDR